MKNNIQLPDYNRSILSISSSIMKYYNVNCKYNSLNELDNIFKKKYQNVVFLILDCVGTNILENNLNKNSFLRKNLLTNVTSVFPPATAAATTAFHSGLSPLESGWIGWMPYLKKYNRAIELFTGYDYYTGEKIINNNQINALNYETVYHKICRKNKNVNFHRCFPSFVKDGANSFEELCAKIKEICNNKKINIVSAYWDETDHIIHANGTKSEAIKQALINIDKNLTELAKTLKDTLIIISADHGAIDLKEVYINEITEINDCLLYPPTIEARFISFIIKKSMKTKFKLALEKHFKGKYLLYTKNKFLKTGLLGQGIKHKMIDEYLGDYILIMTSNISMRYPTQGIKRIHLADHSGITKEEMIVPVIAIDTNNI